MITQNPKGATIITKLWTAYEESNPDLFIKTLKENIPVFIEEAKRIESEKLALADKIISHPASGIVKMERPEIFLLLHLMVPNLIVNDEYVDKQFEYDVDTDSFKLQFHATQGWNTNFCIFRIDRNLDFKLYYFTPRTFDITIKNQIATREMLHKYFNKPN